MTTNKAQQNESDEAQLELAQRLAAAYTSYVAGYRGVDSLLKRTREDGDVGQFWKDLAEFVSLAMAGRREANAQFKEMITKYVQ
jgi:hypothetical protein